jgi:hypothetical protein
MATKCGTYKPNNAGALSHIEPFYLFRGDWKVIFCVNPVLD